MARYVITVYKSPVGASLFKWRAMRRAQMYSPRSAVHVHRVRRGRLQEVC